MTENMKVIIACPMPLLLNRFYASCSVKRLQCFSPSFCGYENTSVSTESMAALPWTLNIFTIGLVESENVCEALGKTSFCVSHFNILTCHIFLPNRQRKCNNKWCANFVVTFFYPLGYKNVTTKLQLTHKEVFPSTDPGDFVKCIVRVHAHLAYVNATHFGSTRKESLNVNA